jgi:hypothetical protein
VSHDINADADLWKAREEIGEKALSIWLEFLSIADRCEGYLPGDHDQLIRHVADKCRSTKRRVSLVYDFALTRLWIKCDPDARVANFAKYHRTRVPNKSHSEPSEPSEPKLTYKVVKKQPYMSSDFLLPDWLPKNEWDEYVEFRIRKKAPLTESIAKRVIAVLRELMELGHPPENVLTEAIDRNWTGLKKDWIHKPGTGFVENKSDQEGLSERTKRILRRGL